MLFKVVEEINENLDKDQQLKLSTETVLLGKEGNVDSILLVNLVVAIEQRIEDEFDIEVNLADERALFEKNQNIPILILYKLKL